MRVKMFGHGNPISDSRKPSVPPRIEAEASVHPLKKYSLFISAMHQRSDTGRIKSWGRINMRAPPHHGSLYCSVTVANITS